MIPEQIVSLILELFAGFGGISLIFLLIWVFLPEKIEKWVTLLHKLLAYASERHERKYIAKSIENRIKSWRRRLCKECAGVLPYAIKINWMDIENVESELQEDTLLVKMRNHRNQSRNLAFATREYVPNTLIPKARPYVNPLIMLGIDYVISKSILSGDTKAFSYFADVVRESFAKPNFKQVVQELEAIHGQGRLTRILLSEYATLATLYPTEPDNLIHQETLNFEKRLFKLLTKKKKEEKTTALGGQHMRVAVVLVGEARKLLMAGIHPHLDYIKGSIERGINNFYISAVGANIPYAKQVCQEAIEDCGLDVIEENEYKGIYYERRKKFYCAHLEKH